MPCGYSACRISLIDLRAAAFQAAARVYPGASPYVSSTDYTRLLGYSVWCTLVSYQFQHIGVGIIPDRYVHNHTYSITHVKEKASFPIEITAQDAHNFWLFNCNKLQLNTCLYRQSLRYFFPTLLPHSRDELKPSVTVHEGTHTHASLVVVLSPLF